MPQSDDVSGKAIFGGWGFNSEESNKLEKTKKKIKGPHILSVLTFKIVENKKCNELLYNSLENNQLCAKSASSEKTVYYVSRCLI